MAPVYGDTLWRCVIVCGISLAVFAASTATMNRYEREHLLNILDSMHKDYRPNFASENVFPSSILLDLLLKSTTPRFIALANGADEAGHCADFVGAALDHHFLLLYSLTCARSRTKQTNCSTYCLSNVNSRTLPFCALLRHSLTH